MTEKTLKARFQQKTDTSANWALATNFIPKKGEIIVYSDLDQIKVGDGVTKVNNLHFVSDVDQVFTKTSKLAQSGVAIEDAIAGRKVDKNTKGEIFNDYVNNKAEGANSHAEGQYTEASGDGAHAEGIGTASVATSASGKGAHAEGNMTKASGRYSHAEGSETRASGKGAHAEGAQSKASGTSAHAEGDSTQAIEAQSHAEGYGGIAAGKYSHIEGRYVSTSLHDPSVSYAKFSYVYKDENTKYVEYIAIQDVPAGIELNNDSYWQVSGTYSESSHAEGQHHFNSVNALASHIEGSENISNGRFAHVEGRFNEATASSSQSHVEGSNNIVSGISAHAEGKYTHAQGASSHAEGQGSDGELPNIAVGTASHVEGYVTKAIGNYSHAEGRETSATEQASHAEGYATNSEGKYSHAEGEYTEATNEGAHAEGVGTSTNKNVASGKASHVEGTQTKASATGAHAEGAGTSAGGQSSHAEGQKTRAIGTASHAEGRVYTPNQHDPTKNYAAFSVVKSNDIPYISIQEVPIGESISNTDYWVEIGALAMDSHAEGLNTTALTGSDQSHVEGWRNIAQAQFQHIEGRENIGNKSHTSVHINGRCLTSTSENQTVLGSCNLTLQDETLKDGSVSQHRKRLFVVGNGKYQVNAGDVEPSTVLSRSNAFEVNEDGTATVGKDPVNNMDVATKKYVDSKDALPPVTAADNGKTLKVVDGAWAVAEGGSTAKTSTFTIAADDWVIQSSGKYQATKTGLTDVKADSIIISDTSTYRATCIAQAEGSLTYELDDIPSNVVVKVVIL